MCSSDLSQLHIDPQQNSDIYTDSVYSALQDNHLDIVYRYLTYLLTYHCYLLIMLVRTGLEAVTHRTTTHSAQLARISRLPLSISAKRMEAFVPITTYHEGKQATKEINVKSSYGAPVVPPGKDEQRKIAPLSSRVFSHLTPTLQKFTLRDRVAEIGRAHV